MTDIDPQAAAQARARLVDALAAAGALRTGPWRAAFAQVPRELFVPAFYGADLGAVPTTYTPVHEGAPGWLDTVYSDAPLTTQLDGRDISPDDTATVTGAPTSSSTRPSLMAVMLDHLDVQDGHRVMEAGTGTGYNAALLCHRLGDQAVTTLDIDPGLCAKAARRLAGANYHPRVVTTDAALGYPPGAPYDRIIATYALRHVPDAWIKQTRPGGRILLTLEAPTFYGYALATVTVREDGTATGRLLPEDTSFMPSRTDVQDPGPAWVIHVERGPGEVRPTGLDPAGLMSADARFLLGLVLPDVVTWYEASPSGASALRMARPGDGSWAAYDPDTGTVEQGGPGRLADQLEDAAAVWDRLGRPGRGEWLVRIDDNEQLLHLPGLTSTLLLPRPA